MAYSEEVKERARQLDPGCWSSYSGQHRHMKQAMDRRRTEALRRAQELEDAEQRVEIGQECIHQRYALEQLRSNCLDERLRAIIDAVAALLDRVEALEDKS